MFRRGQTLVNRYITRAAPPPTHTHIYYCTAVERAATNCAVCDGSGGACPWVLVTLSGWKIETTTLVINE
jgi:hypothetical protein